MTSLSIHSYIYIIILGGNTLEGCRSVLEKYLDLRFREVENLLGIPTHNVVCDWVVFSVCGLGEGKEKQGLEDQIVKSKAMRCDS